MLGLVVLDQHREAAGVDLGVLAEGLLGEEVRPAVQDDLCRLGLADAAVVQPLRLLRRRDRHAGLPRPLQPRIL